mmetsp:Transcript_118302/g.209096  ORF Transcript_118302/g.209096 Transcript_118302/m.209096 type:complete len:86 (+) Transcript_118302:49-306(+)
MSGCASWLSLISLKQRCSCAADAVALRQCTSHPDIPPASSASLWHSIFTGAKIKLIDSYAQHLHMCRTDTGLHISMQTPVNKERS